jgi:RNA polymerase sigma factor (sigma-70 family)
MNDAQLLEQYARERSEPAFSELVRRHADWVYSAAARMVRDPHLAEDVTQAVFLLLAQRAGRIRGNISLGGWLFNTARYCATHALRTKARREKHERQAAAMTPTETDDEQIWSNLSPRLEQYVAKLRPQEREALLLRFYQQKSMAEVGAALGISEDAAKKRVAAGVQKLRSLLGAGGNALSVALLAARITQPCPQAIVAACAKAAVLAPAASAAGIAQGVIKMMVATKIKIAAIAALAVGACIAGGVAVVVISNGNTPSATVAPPPVAAPVAPPAVAVTFDQLDATEQANLKKCAMNLRQIGAAIFMYAKDNDGNCPPTLAAATATVMTDPRVFVCPDSSTQPPSNWNTLSDDQKAQWINSQSDYLYLLAGTSKKLADLPKPSSLVMVYEGDNDHAGGMNLLFGDGHVEWQSIANAQAMIRDSELAIGIPSDAVERRNRGNCAMHMRELTMALYMYADRHQNRLPPDLGTIFTSREMRYPALFLCPDSQNHVPPNWSTLNLEQQAQWISSNSDYTYLGGNVSLRKLQSLDLTGSLAVLYESDSNHHDGVNIAFFDGHVEFQQLENAHATIQNTKSKLTTLRP